MLIYLIVPNLEKQGAESGVYINDTQYFDHVPQVA
jgi:hypothetical protein